VSYTLAGHFGPTFIGGNAGLDATVYEYGTSDVADLFTDSSKDTPADNPVTLDSDGALEFYAAPGQYTVKIGPNRIDVTVHPDASEDDGTDGGGLPTPQAGDAGKAVVVSATEDGFELGNAASDAVDVVYDNTESSLTATDVQAALDELTARIVALETP
jgi:hypothetical protein